MAKTKKETTEQEEAAPETVVSVAVKAPEPARKVSFDQWAARRGVKTEHKRGMRAFVKNPDRVRTMADWDDAFKAY